MNIVRIHSNKNNRIKINESSTADIYYNVETSENNFLKTYLFNDCRYSINENNIICYGLGSDCIAIVIDSFEGDCNLDSSENIKAKLYEYIEKKDKKVWKKTNNLGIKHNNNLMNNIKLPGNNEKFLDLININNIFGPYLPKCPVEYYPIDLVTRKRLKLISNKCSIYAYIRYVYEIDVM